MDKKNIKSIIKYGAMIGVPLTFIYYIKEVKGKGNRPPVHTPTTNNCNMSTNDIINNCITGIQIKTDKSKYVVGEKVTVSYNFIVNKSGACANCIENINNLGKLHGEIFVESANTSKGTSGSSSYTSSSQPSSSSSKQQERPPIGYDFDIKGGSFTLSFNSTGNFKIYIVLDNTKLYSNKVNILVSSPPNPPVPPTPNKCKDKLANCIKSMDISVDNRNARPGERIILSYKFTPKDDDNCKKEFESDLSVNMKYGPNMFTIYVGDKQLHLPISLKGGSIPISFNNTGAYNIRISCAYKDVCCNITSNTVRVVVSGNPVQKGKLSVTIVNKSGTMNRLFLYDATNNAKVIDDYIVSGTKTYTLQVGKYKLSIKQSDGKHCFSNEIEIKANETTSVSCTVNIPIQPSSSSSGTNPQCGIGSKALYTCIDSIRVTGKNGETDIRGIYVGDTVQIKISPIMKNNSDCNLCKNDFDNKIFDGILELINMDKNEVNKTNIKIPGKGTTLPVKFIGEAGTYSVKVNVMAGNTTIGSNTILVHVDNKPSPSSSSGQNSSLGGSSNQQPSKGSSNEAKPAPAPVKTIEPNNKQVVRAEGNNVDITSKKSIIR